MLDRLKFWRKESLPIQASVSIPVNEIREGETVFEALERLKLTPTQRQEDIGDGKAEFLGEGTAEEYEEQKKADDGTLPWYKRMLRKED